MPRFLLTALSAVLVAGLVTVLYIGLFRTHRPPSFTRLLRMGLGVHGLGLLAMWFMLGPGGQGYGDHILYLRAGQQVAEAAAQGGWQALTAPELWGTMPPVVGTRSFVLLTAGLGPAVGWSLLGLSVVFAGIGYGGIIAFSDAVRVALPEHIAQRFTVLLVACPTVAFWTSWLGKESVVFAALGALFLGLALLPLRPWRSWALVIAGTLGMALLRPQVGMVAMVAILPALFVAQTASRRALSLVVAVALLGVLAVGLWHLHVRSWSDIADYLERVKAYNLAHSVSHSGASMVNADGSPLAALVNVLLRPFPWETRTFAQAAASAELYALWLFATWRLRAIGRGLWQQRRVPLVGAILAFGLLYALGLGLAATNLGLIARQRVHLWPALLLTVALATPRPPPDEATPPRLV